MPMLVSHKGAETCALILDWRPFHEIDNRAAKCDACFGAASAGVDRNGVRHADFSSARGQGDREQAVVPWRQQGDNVGSAAAYTAAATYHCR